MNRPMEILERQRQATARSIEYTDNLIQPSSQLKIFQYSLLWTVYRTITDEDYRFRPKMSRPAILFSGQLPPDRYYLHSGNIPGSIIEAFEKNHIHGMDLRLTGMGIGYIISGALKFPRSFKYKNIYQIKDSIETERSIRDLINSNIVDIERFSSVLDKLFCEKKPLFILLDQDRTKFRRIIAMKAHQHSIPVYVIQHGMTPACTDNSIPFANESFFPIHCDKIFTWGRHAAQYLIEGGVNPENIIEAGNPYIPDIDDSIRPSGELLVIDQQFEGQEEEREFSYRKLTDALESSGREYSIYLRNDYNREFLTKIAGKGRVLSWSKDSAAANMLKHCITLGFYSSALIESIALNRPAVACDFMGRGNVMGFEGRGLFYADSSDFERSIEQALEISGRADLSRTLQRFCTRRGPDAGRFIARSIMEML
ncbi:MAG: hypothetical protein R6U31_05445 [bacterium]